MSKGFDSAIHSASCSGDLNQTPSSSCAASVSSMKRAEEKKPSSGVFRIKPRKVVAGFVDIISSFSRQSKKHPSKVRSPSHPQRKNSAPPSSTYSAKLQTLNRDPKLLTENNEMQQSQSISMIKDFYVIQQSDVATSLQPKQLEGQSTAIEGPLRLSNMQWPLVQEDKFRDAVKHPTSVQMSDANLQKFASYFNRETHLKNGKPLRQEEEEVNLIAAFPTTCQFLLFYRPNTAPKQRSRRFNPSSPLLPRPGCLRFDFSS